jgi:hypothetical protein
MSFPATFNIQYYKGDIYQFVIRPKQSNGDPFPIDDTTHNAFFRIAPSRGGSIGNTRTASAIIEEGNIVATILPSVGNALTATTPYFYDISVQGKPPNSDQVYTIVTGSLTVTQDITGTS